MKGRLFSQAFCIAACVGGHHYYAQKAEQRELEKKERYEAERDHICRQTGITHEEFELRKVKEAEERKMMKVKCYPPGCQMGLNVKFRPLT